MQQVGLSNERKLITSMARWNVHSVAHLDA